MSAILDYVHTFLVFEFFSEIPPRFYKTLQCNKAGCLFYVIYHSDKGGPE